MDEILSSKNLKGKDFFEKYYNFKNKEKDQRYIITFVDVKLSLIKEKDDIDKVSSTRAKWRAVKTFIDTMLGDVSREKISIINDKIIPNFSKYVPLTIPITTNATEIMFDGFFMAFLDKEMLLNDLKEVGLLGNKERDLKIGLVDCSGIGFSKRLITKKLSPLNYPLEDFGIGLCEPSNYYENALDKQVDVIIMIQEKVKVSQSLVGGNLKTFNSSIDITAFDPYLRKPLLSLSKGAVVYHMNEEDGKELALKNSFQSAWESLERELNLLEKTLSSDENRKKLKKITLCREIFTTP